MGVCPHGVFLWQKSSGRALGSASASYFRISPLLTWMGIKWLSCAALADFWNVLRLNGSNLRSGSNSDGKTSNFKGAVILRTLHKYLTLRTSMGMASHDGPGSCSYTVWPLCQAGFKVQHTFWSSALFPQRSGLSRHFAIGQFHLSWTQCKNFVNIFSTLRENPLIAVIPLKWIYVNVSV